MTSQSARNLGIRETYSFILNSPNYRTMVNMASDTNTKSKILMSAKSRDDHHRNSVIMTFCVEHDAKNVTIRILIIIRIAARRKELVVPAVVRRSPS